MIHYYLCRERDNFLRIGIEGDKDKASEFFSRYYGSVEYIGEFADVIYTDVDTDVGVGNRKFPGFIIRTCKYIYQLRSKKDDKDYFEYLREYHKGLQVSVEQAWKRKEDIRMRKEAKDNAGNQ